MGTVYLRNTTAPDSTYVNRAATLSHADVDNNLKLFLRNDVPDVKTGDLTANAIYTGNTTTTTFNSNSNLSSATKYCQIKWNVSSNYTWRFQNDRNVTVYASTTLLWSTGTGISDIRLKDNIQPLTNGIQRLKLLNPVTYTWKVDTPLADGGITHEGFIAQELIDIVPDAVKVMDDNYLVHKKELVPLFVKALQEAIAKIEELETRLANSKL